MSFRKLQSVRLPEERQGLIYYTCRTYRDQPERVKQKIRRLCGECGGGYADALFTLLTSGRSVTSVAMEFHLAESTLYRCRKRFYERFHSARSARKAP